MTAIHLLDAGQPDRLAAVRALLYQYGQERHFDAALGNYTAELNDLPGCYAPPAGALLLATFQQHAAGCVAFRLLNQATCEMKRLYVAPVFRGRGIARQLIQELLYTGRKAGYRSMRLDSHPHMLAAQHLYQAFGFRQIDAYNDNPTPGIRFFERML